MKAFRFLIAAVLFAAPATASAQSWEHAWSLCTTHHFSACHDISLTTEAIFSGVTRVGTTLSVSMHNLQGQGFPSDFTAASGLHEVVLAGAGVQVGQLTGTSVGVVAGGATGGGTWDWSTGHYVSGLGPMGFVSVRSPNGGFTSMLGGCSELPLVAGFQVGPRTCAPESTWTVSFDLNHIVDANQFAGVYMYTASTNAGTWCWHNRENFNADGFGDCTVHNDAVAQINATPEPITLALIGTGLAGIGGARLRRRRSGAGGT